MSKVISLRFHDAQVRRLERIARRLGRTPSETGALLVEESLRRAEFAFIDFRDSPLGRQVHIQGSSLAVWEVILVAREYEMDRKRTAGHLNWPVFRVQAAFNYAAAFPEEIENAIQDNASYDLASISGMLPLTTPFRAGNGESSNPPAAKET